MGGPFFRNENNKKSTAKAMLPEAGNENRTRDLTLGRLCFTTELYPQVIKSINFYIIPYFWRLSPLFWKKVNFLVIKLITPR